MKKILLVFLTISVLFTACKDNAEDFVPTNPSISQIVPSMALANETVSLKGKRFAKDAGANIVKFAGVRAEVLTASDTLLTVKVPAEGSTGNVTITVNERTSKGPLFTYGAVQLEFNYVTSTYAGTGIVGDTYGTLTEAQFMLPNGVAFDPSTGDLIVTDRTGQSIKRISKEGMVTKIAGTGAKGSVNGALSVATFNNPYKSAVDKHGNIYVADNGSNSVRKIDFTTNTVSTLAGGNATGAFADGQGTNARFNTITGIAVDEDGFVYVADAVNHAVRKISPTGMVTTLAGNGTEGIIDGEWPNVRMGRPTAVCVGKDGFVYAADRYGQRIRKINRHTGKTVTIAGSGGSTSSTGAQVDGEALKARFNNPWGIEAAADGTIYVSELGASGSATHTIRMIKDGIVSTIAGNASFKAPGYVNGIQGISRFNNPTDLAVDNEGNIYVGDMNNYVIRKITKVPKP
ncbi:IPT/TIG domain-containing protein [uncultured Pedobacter sp.]|uniref:IPT/TIG domain-containing protein n=1 Tax=uncultured Pedobacter sp. TaxID=246139 RepID=UPI0026362B64|nr:IPT/TIG domain-containing protein [uncultured Pedobacter sp.]